MTNGMDKIETVIVDALIERAAKLNYSLRVFGGQGEYGQSGTYDVKAALSDLGVATVIVADEDEGYVGSVMLVFGNGCDLISDYGPVGIEDDGPMSKIEDFILPICKIAEEWS